MISIHQSQFLPWLPYFYKILKSDLFVILDNVQFQKNGFQNRNMIKTPRGSLWLTIPVKHKFGLPINEVKVVNKDVYSKILKTLHLNYVRSEFYFEVYTILKDVFNHMFLALNELNNELLDRILNIIGIRSQIFMSSAINTHKKKDDLLIEIIEHFRETDYLSGPGALNYMDLRKFQKRGIKVYVYDFNYVEYKQLWTKQIGFLPNLSIIDLIFNELKGAKEYILQAGSLKRVV